MKRTSLTGRRKDGSLYLPGYSFRITDALLTNFHLPRSTLLMLVSAFAGKNEVMQIYHEAVQKDIVFIALGMQCLYYNLFDTFFLLI